MYMKKITLILCFVTVLVQSSFAWGWAVRDVARQTSENPVYYLGDQVSFAWILNSTSWSATFKKAGIGSINSSAEMNWQDIVWVNEGGDGYGKNEGIKSATYTVNSVGTWYYSIWLGWGTNVGNNGTWSDGNSVWAEGNTSFESSSFTVSALENPLSQTATAYSNYQIDLSLTNWNSKNVMIVRRLTSDAVSNAPTQGTAYTVGASLGTGIVVYNSNGTSFNDTGLTPGTGYTYIFYSENNSYYSAGSSANATTTAVSAVTDYFRSKTTGNWSAAGSWESSSNGSSNWITATLVPGSSAAAITIQSGHNISLDANVTVTGLTINSGGTLVVEAAKQLTINTALTNNGTLTLKSANNIGTATIITLGTVTGSGPTEVEQFVSSAATGLTGRNWYISSPLTAATSSTITTVTENGLVYYNGSTWVAAGTTMDVMKGYIVKSPNGNKTIKFTGGSLNTGNKSVTDLPLGFNLVGNPYASYVDFAQATKTGVENSIWYRSKSSGSYVFQTYNVPSNVGANDGSAIIPPLQSFWIKTTSGTNTFGFTNAMRSHQDQSVATNRLKAPAVSTQKMLRLEIANSTNKDETVVYFNENALNTFDEYDSQKMFNETAGVPEIYTHTDSKDLVINGFNTIQLNTEIPLGFRTGLIEPTNLYTLKATQLQNFGTDTELVLIDKDISNSETIMSEGSEYSFNSAAVNTTNRFSILFRAKGTTTGGCCNNNEYKDILVYKNANNQICIDLKSELNKVQNIAVYNAMGQRITETKPMQANTILNVAFETGVYFVKLNIDNKTITRKVIIK